MLKYYHFKNTSYIKVLICNGSKKKERTTGLRPYFYVITVFCGKTAQSISK
jgi:hypothetical protein